MVYYENLIIVSGDHIEVSTDVRVALQKKGHVLEGLSHGTICQFIVQDIESFKNNVSVGKLMVVNDLRKGKFLADF